MLLQTNLTIADCKIKRTGFLKSIHHRKFTITLSVSLSKHLAIILMYIKWKLNKMKSRFRKNFDK